jgi:hypothetical protein
VALFDKNGDEQLSFDELFGRETAKKQAEYKVGRRLQVYRYVQVPGYSQSCRQCSSSEFNWSFTDILVLDAHIEYCLTCCCHFFTSIASTIHYPQPLFAAADQDDSKTLDAEELVS